MEDKSLANVVLSLQELQLCARCILRFVDERNSSLYERGYEVGEQCCCYIKLKDNTRSSFQRRTQRHRNCPGDILEYCERRTQSLVSGGGAQPLEPSPKSAPGK